MTEQPEPTDLDLVIDHAARNQWNRMTRTTTAFDDLTPTDQHAVVALVTPIGRDTLTAAATVGSLCLEDL